MHSLGAQKAVLLIIDRDPFMLTGIAAVLDHQGYECHCARDGEAALKGVRGIVPDLILCDTDLGEESGLELCGEIRQQAQMADVPIVFMSASRDPEIVQKTHEAGGAYYLGKPFDPNVLSDVVDRALWMPHLINRRIEAQHAIQASGGAARSHRANSVA